MQKLNWKNGLKIGLGILAVYLAIHYWPNVSEIIGTVLSAATPIFVGAVLAYLINILMSFYERHYFPKSGKKSAAKTRRPVCLAGAIITILGLVALVGILIVPQLINCVKMLVAELPGAIEVLINKLSGFDFIPKNIFETLSGIDWKSRITDIVGTLTTGIGSVMDVAVTAVSSVFSVVSDFVIGLIFALYILLDKNRLVAQTGKVSRKYIPERWLKKITHVLSVANDCFRRFIVGQCTEAVILGTLCTIGMLILRLPYAPMIGALTAFTALIPIFGAFIGAGVGAFLILMESPVKALIFLIFIVVLQQLEGNLIYPKVVGSSIGLPGIWVLAAVTVGGGVFGISGMLIGVPTAAVIYRLVKEDVNRPKPEEITASEEPQEKTE